MSWIRVALVVPRLLASLTVAAALMAAVVRLEAAQFVFEPLSSAAIDRDLRVFTVVAALNAAGFDVELAPQYHPVRQQVRQQLEGLDPELRRRLSEFYQQHRGDTPDEDEFARYISFALNLTDPPEMQMVQQDMFLPPEVRDLQPFVGLLNEFYRTANIPTLWARLAPTYDAALNDMAGPLREAVIRTDAYLREPTGTGRGRQLVAYLELAAPVNSVHVRNYSDNLYMVFGYSASVPVEDVRHAYLHLVLDPIVTRSREDLASRSAMTDWISDVAGVRADYAEDFEILVSESLIRAAELRMTGDRPGQSPIDSAYRSGLLLTPFFLDQLEEFEQSPLGIREFFRDMVLALDLGRERRRFDERFNTIELAEDVGPRAEVPAPLISNPVRELLVAAQDAFNSGNNAAAREAFETVLYQHDANNGPALYGLALIASREGDPGEASDFFSRTLESGNAEPAMQVWSHVFLGRLHDIECERDLALEHYRAAIEVGDDSNAAQVAARSGIEEPFGGECGL